MGTQAEACQAMLSLLLLFKQPTLFPKQNTRGSLGPRGCSRHPKPLWPGKYFRTAINHSHVLLGLAVDVRTLQAGDAWHGIISEPHWCPSQCIPASPSLRGVIWWKCRYSLTMLTGSISDLRKRDTPLVSLLINIVMVKLTLPESESGHKKGDRVKRIQLSINF